jgi:hypothetical protein
MDKTAMKSKATRLDTRLDTVANQLKNSNKGVISKQQMDVINKELHHLVGQSKRKGDRP